MSIIIIESDSDFDMSVAYNTMDIEPDTQKAATSNESLLATPKVEQSALNVTFTPEESNNVFTAEKKRASPTTELNKTFSPVPSVPSVPSVKICPPTDERKRPRNASKTDDEDNIPCRRSARISNLNSNSKSQPKSTGAIRKTPMKRRENPPPPPPTFDQPDEMPQSVVEVAKETPASVAEPEENPVDVGQKENSPAPSEESAEISSPVTKPEKNSSPLVIPSSVPRALLQRKSPTVLKSIRKRSFSVTDIDQPPRRNLRVQFHSPANMEKTISEIDQSMQLNFSKTITSTAGPAARRQRSLSNTETIQDREAYTMSASKSPKLKGVNSPRFKMPNFAAIHERNFNNMENLVDYQERRKERAQFLLNSSDKRNNSNVLKDANRGAFSKIPQKSEMNKKSLFKIKKSIDRKVPKPTAIKMSDKKIKAIISAQNLDKRGILDKTDKNHSKIDVTANGVANKTMEDMQSQSTVIVEAPRSAKKDAAARKRPIPVNLVHPIPRANEVAPLDDKEKNPNNVLRGVRLNRRFELMMKHRNHKK